MNFRDFCFPYKIQYFLHYSLEFYHKENNHSIWQKRKNKASINVTNKQWKLVNHKVSRDNLIFSWEIKDKV